MKTKEKTKKVKITNYKKAYEDLLLKHTHLCRQANACTQWAGALLAAENIKQAALEEMRNSRSEIIKFD